MRDGDSGYCAAIECRSVQVLRPRSSTSGGQSEGWRKGLSVAAFAPGFVCAALNEANELQERQLEK